MALCHSSVSSCICSSTAFSPGARHFCPSTSMNCVKVGMRAFFGTTDLLLILRQNCYGEPTWCVFEHHPVLSRAHVQGVIERWSQTWSEAIRHHKSPGVRVAWKFCLKHLVVRLRLNAARAVQDLRNPSRDDVDFSDVHFYPIFGSCLRFLQMMFLLHSVS